MYQILNEFDFLASLLPPCINRKRDQYTDNNCRCFGSAAIIDASFISESCRKLRLPVNFKIEDVAPIVVSGSIKASPRSCGFSRIDFNKK
jgi:hypothetical protein